MLRRPVWNPALEPVLGYTLEAILPCLTDVWTLYAVRCVPRVCFVCLYCLLCFFWVRSSVLCAHEWTLTFSR